jgi:hypothetical protein
MHGLIHSELKRFTETTYGVAAWKAVLERAGYKDKMYLTVKPYADEEALAIVAAASELLDLPPATVLEAFGRFTAPALMRMYASKVDPSWGTLEMLLNTEHTIHTVVRSTQPGAEPPTLRFERVDGESVRLEYRSPRGMSAVAKGIIQGVADFYGDVVEITESELPENGTELFVRKVA